MNNFPILAIMALFLGAFINSTVSHYSRKAANVVVLLAMVVAFGLVCAMVPAVFFEGQVVTSWMGNWLPLGNWAYGIGLEVDALSLFFGIVAVIAILAAGLYSFTYMDKDEGQDSYYTLFLMLGGSILGFVFSGDLFNMYVMVEIMTFSAVSLTAFRNEEEGSLESAFRYLVVGSIGSTALLIGTISIYANLHTLNLAQIAWLAPGEHNISMIIAFGFLLIGYFSKAFLFPFQPLAADAHAVAPASISLMISGVLTKCGVYGAIRLVYCLFTNIYTPSVSYLVTGVGAFTMFICVTMAFNQHNFKRLLAFHSISQLGYVITAVGLGTPLGLAAGLFHAINHTVFKGLLFLVAGSVQRQTGTLDLDSLGGLAKKMPKTTLLFLIGAASISGIPPFNGFASKWMIYQSIFAKAAETNNFFYVIVCVIALITSVLTLASFVKVGQSVFYGQLNKKYENTVESETSMHFPMWILAVLCIALGVAYVPFTNYILTPAVGAAFSVGTYITSMLGGTAATMDIVLEYIGSWNPINFLVLLLLATCAVTIFSVSSRRLEPEELPVDTPVLPEDAKYEPFFSGEESHYSQVGGSDLFWGFKVNLKKYFSFWSAWHSGDVADYALYATVMTAAVLLFCIVCL